MPKVQMRTARTEKTNPHEAAEDLLSQIGPFEPKLVLMFASRSYDHGGLNRALRERLPSEVPFAGASSSHEIDRLGIHKNSVMLTVLGGDLEVAVGLGEGLSKDGVNAGTQAINEACAALGQRPEDLDPRRHVGIVIDDGSRNKKEELLLGVLERNQALVLVGGGASDAEPDPSKQSPLVHAGGRIAGDAAIVVLIKTDAPYRVLRSHWYQPTGQTLKITKVDESHTRALEIDGKPAAERYAELLGVSVDDLPYGKPSGFSTFPTALRVGREYFIRAPWYPLPDKSILFANLLDEGTEYEIMKAGDAVQSTRRFFEEEVPSRVPSPQGVLVFHCNGRWMLAEGSGQAAELAETFRTSIPCAGLNVYFEVYCGFSINNTLTSLVFGAS